MPRSPMLQICPSHSHTLVGPAVVRRLGRRSHSAKRMDMESLTTSEMGGPSTLEVEAEARRRQYADRRQMQTGIAMAATDPAVQPKQVADPGQ